LLPSENAAHALMRVVQGKVVEKISGTLTPQGVETLVAKALKVAAQTASMKTQASHNETLIAAGKLLSQGEPDKAAELYEQARGKGEGGQGALLSRERQRSRETDTDGQRDRQRQI
jgi:hypothetical protein